VKTITAAGGKAAVNGEDVGSWEGARRAIAQAYDQYGRLDILVNNAGVLRDRMSFNMSEEEFDLVMRVHCKGHFAMARHACERWRDQAKTSGSVYGRIINTSSEAGLMGSAGNANYAMAKAAIAAGADGVIVEVHPDPRNAMSDGQQSLTPGQFKELMAGLGKVAGAVGRSVA
jgi:NAD(P)-dependent dehydrogenase (short-subunit alcohol dehydrogenase family)